MTPWSVQRAAGAAAPEPASYHAAPRTRPRTARATAAGGRPKARHPGRVRELPHPGELAARQGARARLHARRRLGQRELAVEDGAELAHADRLGGRPRERAGGACRRHFLERPGGQHLVDAQLDALRERGAVITGVQRQQPVRVAAVGAPELVRLRPALGTLVERLEGADDAARVAHVHARRRLRGAPPELGDHGRRIALPARLQRAPARLVRRTREGEVAERGSQVQA